MTTNEAFAIFALILAGNGFIIVFFAWLLKRDTSSLKKAVTSLEKHVAFTTSSVDALVEWLIILEAILTSKEELLDKLISEVWGENELECFTNGPRIRKEELNRRKHELMLHSSDLERKQAAYIKLGHGIGNIESYEIMCRLIQLCPEDKKYFISHVKALKQMLKDLK